MQQDDEIREVGSPIAEDDEIEEDFVPATDSKSWENTLKRPMLKPTDTVVLELSTAPPKSRLSC